jgi:streptomycin 6-kinase
MNVNANAKLGTDEGTGYHFQSSSFKLDDELSGRLRMIEAAIKDLQSRELDREDDDDESIRLEAELSDETVHPAVIASMLSVYDQLRSLLTLADLMRTLLEDAPTEGEMLNFYDEAARVVDELAEAAYESKASLGMFIFRNTPDVFTRQVDEEEEDD